MIGAFARFSKQRLAQALWLDNKGEGGFRWFHEQGLPAPYVLNQVQINVGQTVSDEILKLRLIAAQSDGRLIDTKDPKKLADEFDRDALHISLTLRGQVVAAGRLIFLNGDRRRSEIDRQLTQLPHQVIAVPGTVEISRVCTHPDFRGGLLLTLLLAECAWQAYIHGGQHLLCFCVRPLVPVYTKFAGHELPYKGSHPLYSGKESYVIRIDLLKVMRGESVPWVAWARFLAPRLALHTVLLRHPRPKLIVCLQALAARMLRPCLDQILMLAMAKVWANGRI